MAKKQAAKEQRKRGDRWLFILILLLFLGGLGIRGYGYMTQTAGGAQGARPEIAPRSQQKGFTTNLREGEPRAIRPNVDAPADGGDLVNTLAPYLTEGGLSFFLGFCIGYVLRLVAKTVMFLIGAIYIVLILFSHYGLITVDWGSFQHIVQQLLLNTKTQVAGLQGILTVGLPSVTMGCLGIWRGVRKP